MAKLSDLKIKLFTDGADDQRADHAMQQQPEAEPGIVERKEQARREERQGREGYRQREQPPMRRRGAQERQAAEHGRRGGHDEAEIAIGTGTDIVLRPLTFRHRTHVSPALTAMA